MRNMEDYQNIYLKDSFERYQEIFRRKKVKEVIEEFCGCNKNPHILEIGCGVNPLFSDYGNDISFTVVEPADILFKKAESLSRSYKNVKCCHGFFEDYSKKLSEEKFDIIICSSLLHEVEHPEVLLRHISSVCSDNTIVHINVPNASSLHRLLAKEMNIIESIYNPSELNNALQQHTIFDIDSLKKMIHECVMPGSEAVEISSGSYFLKPFTHKQMQQCMQHGIINTAMLDGLNNLCKGELQWLGSEIFVNYKVKPHGE